MRVPVLVSLSLALAISPAAAQSRSPQSTASAIGSQDEDQPLPQQQQHQTPLDINPSGRTARSSVGQVGKRQTRDTAAQQVGIEPMARIASRVQNRNPCCSFVAWRESNGLSIIRKALKRLEIPTSDRNREEIS